MQPDGRGALNPRGVAWYRRLVEGLLERGIEPIATLYHWDLPQARQEAGGWAVRDTALRFAEYAAAMAAELGDVVEGWITHNEPWVVAFLGHAEGRKAPGIRDWPTALTVAHNLLLSHGLAVDALRAAVKAPVGITFNLNPMRGDADAVARMDAYQNRWFLDPVLRGTLSGRAVRALRARLRRRCRWLNPEDLDVISRPIDFLGVNYYNPTHVRESAECAAAGRDRSRRAGTRPRWAGRSTRADCTTCCCGCGPTTATCRSGSPRTAPRSTTSDWSTASSRIRRGSRSCATTWPPCGPRVADGVDVRRYHAWSLLDNFEWEHGYDKRFGIVRVDYATQERIPKRSALWYRDHIAAAREGGLMASIAFEEVSKVFPDGTKAVDGLSLEIADGEFTILVGPSGSGKSTALRMVAGLEEATSGDISIGSRVVNDVAPRDRDIAMVFQSYALYPHMSVAQNMGFALKMQKVGSDSIRSRVGRAASRLGIGELLERRPRALSGGQRQRVALGRAIVRSPEAFLMDEPLSNLDAKLRVEMRAYIARLHQELGTTTLVRHPRPDRGDDDGRPRRGHARREAWSRSTRPSGSTRTRRTCSWPASSAPRR